MRSVWKYYTTTAADKTETEMLSEYLTWIFQFINVGLNVKC